MSSSSFFKSSGTSVTIQNTIDTLITDAEAAKAAAETAASNASTSAGLSSTYANNSNDSANSSASSLSSAQTAQSAAETAETNAETAQAAAETAETNAASSASTASTQASNASTSATNAASSASTASTKASEASTSATNAATSETNAATSATNASSSATTASGHASTASTQASNASTSATNAATSETNAATSATTASTQASNASTSATNAATSASTASTQATNASNSATAAATSATNASNSATAAASSATTAQSLSDSFNNIYLGALSSAPSQDPDGSALDEGDLYYDTTQGELKVYKSSGWAAAGSTVNGTSARFHYDITTTTGTLSGSDANGNTLAYDAGYVDVYVNGVRMSDADVTTTSGNSIVFTEDLVNGDDVDIVAYGTFVITQLNADNLDSGTVPSARVSGAYTGITSVGTLTSFASTGIDDNASSTAMTLDSSGRLLVGKTSTNFGVEGLELGGADGKIFVTRDENSVYLNRLSSDGSIVQFYKDSSLVGSIGSISGTGVSLISTTGGVQIGSSDAGFNFNGAGNYILPWNVGANTSNDGGIDLGASTHRFKNLYLSGGVYLGGTGSANFLDDYEEGTFEVTASPETSGTITLTSGDNTFAYTKVGRMVTITGLFVVSAVSSPVGDYVRILGLPFTQANLTENSERVGISCIYYDYPEATPFGVEPAITIGAVAEFRIYRPANTWGVTDNVYVNFSYFTT